MRLSNKHRGFTLPAVLVVVAALLILAVGVLLLVGIERDTARSFVDRQRAELAARAGLEDLRGLLTAETANDDYIVLQSELRKPITAGAQTAPHLFIGRGTASTGDFNFRYIPLFSTASRPGDAVLQAPAIEALTGTNPNQYIEFTTLPYHDKVRAAWLPVLDEKGRTVARYAYWVEDLQARVDPAIAGNQKGTGETHARVAWPFPAAGLNDQPESADEPALDQIALFALDPAATDAAQGELGKTLFKNRPLLLSPDSQLAAAGLRPPLNRLKAEDPASGGKIGDLTDPKARAVERGLVAGIQPYLERPIVPHAQGIDPSVAGQPKLNLNRLLADAPAAAVDEMADFIKKALPKFDERKGGFPEDYLKTLAANAIDYADEDSEATVKTGEYRGLDAHPLLSESVIQINYVGISNREDRKIMTFRFKLFAELVNPTTLPVSGEARLSYEVDLRMDGVGAEIGDIPFDDPELLGDPEASTHNLSLIGGSYWTQPVTVSLMPNQYRFYQFADVTYYIDVGPSSIWIPGSQPFSLNETRGSRGSSLMWGGVEVDRTWKIVRQEGLVSTNGGFRVGTAKTSTKAALPGHVYDNFWPSMHYNMGDPRITYYLRQSPAAESAYPANVSPNRRNIRLNIYTKDAAAKPKVYARQLPSEWPDGGHNAPVGSWSPGTNDKTEPTAAQFNYTYTAAMKDSAIQPISNLGRFYSATELGRIFDPIMFKPSFPSVSETNSLINQGLIPAGKNWPDAASGQASPFYGGGNTLRIGRPEHPAFDSDPKEGKHATRLLDLFHAGLSRSSNKDEREGPVVRIHGHVNINTASRDALRALAAGALTMDPLLSRKVSNNHLNAPTMAPPTQKISLTAPTEKLLADKVADAIINGRPYSTPSDMARAKGSDGVQVFGNRALYPQNTNIEWNDAAAEELFARVYESSTIRSRNFRVWVVGQSIAPTTSATAQPEILSEVRKVFSVFVDPGQRDETGAINPTAVKIKISSENDF